MKAKIELDDAIKICKREKRKNAILNEEFSLIIKWLNELKYKRKELKIYKKAYKMLAERFLVQRQQRSYGILFG